jgi:ribosomal protein S18 acetylase RimI-like enzyme
LSIEQEPTAQRVIAVAIEAAMNEVQQRGGAMPPTDLILRDVQVADAEALAHVLITAFDAAFRDRVPDPCLAFTEEESAANWRRSLTEGLSPGDLLVVAEPPGGRPIGYAWGGPHDAPDYRGELRQIALLPSEQGKGIGRLLVGHVASRLAAQGIRSMRVEVLRDNPHRRFYERLGARLLAEDTYDWDGVVMPMCVYGWADTQPLLDG